MILPKRLSLRVDDVQIVAGSSAATKGLAVAGLDDDDAVKKVLS